MSIIKKNIANIITLSNLLCGLISILYAFGGHLNIASGVVILGAILDLLDGFFARLLKTHSTIGKQLDSMADLITFGVAPAIIMFQLLFLLEYNVFFNPFENWESRIAYKKSFIAYTALLIPLFSALRLSKFNIDKKQTHNFIGMPTPESALFLISIAVIINSYPNYFLLDYITNIKTISILIVIICFLMVSKLPLFSLKFKNYNWSENKMRYLFIICIIILLWQFYFAAIPFIVILHIILSILNNLIQ